MKTQTKKIWGINWVPIVAAMLIPVGKAFAQGDTPPDHIASLSFYIIVVLAVYAYVAFSVQIIARKTETPNDWFAWIPIANLFLLLAIAKKPLWWFFLMLIPFVNVVIFIIVWMRIAENVGKPSWWALLTLLPLVGLIVPGYLAWSD